MIRFILVVLAFGLFIGEHSALSAGVTHFDQLVGFFEKGSLPTNQNQEMIGWYSGRCYTKDIESANTPAAGILVVTEKIKGGVDQGPLFPPQKMLQVLPYSARYGLAATLYDELTPEIEKEIQTYVDANTTFEAIAENQSLVTKWYLVDAYRLRKYEAYYLLQAVAVRAEPAKEVKVGDVTAMCYFFKKVK